MWDDIFCTKGCPFKMKIEQPQPHNLRKMKRQGLQAHHGLPVVSSVSSLPFLLLCYGRGRFGGAVVTLFQALLNVKCWVKMVKNIHTSLKNNTQA